MNKNHLVINIAASRRFHLCNLAVELSRMGYDVRFYSYVPNKRLARFGLQSQYSCSLFWIMIPVLACLKLSKRAAWAIRLEWYVMDHIVGWFMRKCDVFIAMSSIYNYSFKIAKERFSARTFLERGSVHALQLKELYDERNINRNTNKNGYYELKSDFAIKRELEMYDFVDVISIASKTVYNTFTKFGGPVDKLFINPYGENLSLFPPTTLCPTNQYDVIMVGNWSWMKGCDLLIEACKKLNLKLIHVGSCSMEFPQESNFYDVGVVDQKEVHKYMGQAKIFVLPSRQEGLAMVQIQALSSGLPLVCSAYTGGNTIKEYLGNTKYVKEFNPYNVDALCCSIREALLLANKQKGVRIIEKEMNCVFSAHAYAQRYLDKILKNI